MLSNATFILEKHCAKAKVEESANFDIPLGLSYERLSGEEKLLKRILSKIANDLGNFLGVSPNDMNLSATADSTRFIAWNRRQKWSTAATLVSVKIVTQNLQDSEAASSQLNRSLANKTLVLPSTVQAVAHECKNCAGVGGAASLQSGADLTATLLFPNHTAAYSGVAALSSVATVVAAIIGILGYSIR